MLEAGIDEKLLQENGFVDRNNFGANEVVIILNPTEYSLREADIDREIV